MEEPRTPPTVAEPVEPHDPYPPQPDQLAPEVVSATGKPTGAPEAARAQSGAYLTTSLGARLRDTDHSLKAGERGPTLLQDHHLREKITHFDHERIPERVVHARGAGAHGVFRGYGTARRADHGRLPGDGVETPVFVRFSTVLGSRGFGRHRPGHPRLRGEVLHRRGHLRPRRQQHAGLLHPGRHQVPRRHPRRQATSGSGDPAGTVAPTTPSGTSSRSTPRLSTTRCGTCPTAAFRLLPDDGGLRRPHLPARRRRRRDRRW